MLPSLMVQVVLVVLEVVVVRPRVRMVCHHPQQALCQQQLAAAAAAGALLMPWHPQQQ
jgi:hypothetical protein